MKAVRGPYTTVSRGYEAPRQFAAILRLVERTPSLLAENLYDTMRHHENDGQRPLSPAAVRRLEVFINAALPDPLEANQAIWAVQEAGARHG